MATIAVYTNFGGHIIKENRGGTKRGYVPDPLGSTIALVDSTGAVTDTWEYDAYGEVESHTGSSTTPFTFVGTLGYFRDLVSSLTYVRARYYQALIGQWMTTDPIWPRQQAYGYCNNRPTSRTDRFGLFAVPIWAVACLGAGIVTFFGNLIGGDDLGTAACKALVSCLLGAAVALILESPWATNFIRGCLAGGGLSLLADLINELLCDEDPCKINLSQQDKICAIANAVLSCILSGFGAVVDNDLTDTIISAIVGILGVDCSGAADLFDFQD